MLFLTERAVAGLLCTSNGDDKGFSVLITLVEPEVGRVDRIDRALTDDLKVAPVFSEADFLEDNGRIGIFDNLGDILGDSLGLFASNVAYFLRVWIGML
mmetsp:Transcript_30324/g.29978  ORF Transcript_30324/g.29978 Transcript_30324/m.29978 type:complete len:99 (-) Transcript_30324:552-848(-)